MLAPMVVLTAGGKATHKVVDNFRDPLAVTVEDEAVDTYVLIMGNTQLFDKSLLVAQGAKGGHEPAVAVAALPYVVSGRAVDVELWCVEDVNNALGALGLEVDAGGFAIAQVGDGLQAVH